MKRLYMSYVLIDLTGTVINGDLYVTLKDGILNQKSIEACKNMVRDSFSLPVSVDIIFLNITELDE